jgi:hypothetical protein
MESIAARWVGWAVRFTVFRPGEFLDFVIAGVAASCDGAARNPLT